MIKKCKFCFYGICRRKKDKQIGGMRCSKKMSDDCPNYALGEKDEA